MKSIAFITSQAFSLVNFRGPLIRALIANRVIVYALAPDFEDETRRQIVALGAVPIDCNLSRTGLNPLVGISDIWLLSRVLLRLRPDVVLSYFIKPVIFGSLAAWIARVPDRFAMIEGLGYSFEGVPGMQPSRWMLKKVVSILFRLALRRTKKVFFLNADDSSLLLRIGAVTADQIVAIDGIGLDLGWYVETKPCLSPMTFVLVARMIREKGIDDFIAAARLIRERHPATRFLLVGGVDLNPGSVTRKQLAAWHEEGVVEWTGHVGDVRPVLAKASVFVLPSYYREGLPRSTQEAMAMGRPVITTDWIGCRDTVVDGVSGFLVPIRSPAAIASAMNRFIESPSLVESMGREGRRIAEARFDVNRINQEIMRAMDLRNVESEVGVITKRVLFIVNDASFFVSHRIGLGLAAQSLGFEVHVATPPGEAVREIMNAGMVHEPVQLTRTGYNVFSDLSFLIKLFRLILTVKPVVAHLVTIKPSLYGSIVCRLIGVPRVVVAIAGLGSLLSEQSSIHRQAMRNIVLAVYRWSFSSPAVRVIVQNTRDREFMTKECRLRPESVFLIAGSGVSLTEYSRAIA